MTRYAVDVQQRGLLRTWESRTERLAAVVLDLPSVYSIEDCHALAEALTSLSEGLWRAYARSGLELGDGAARGRKRRLGNLLVRTGGAIRPSSAGTLTAVQLSAPEDRYTVSLADRVAEAMSSLDDAELQELIIREVEEETAAVERADRGLFSGRAAQATLISRAFVLAPHLREADVRFREQVFGDVWGSGLLGSSGSRELADLDPTAAAAAAVHWFKAAVDVLSEVSGKTSEDAVMTADDSQRTSAALLLSVVRLVDSGNTPQAVATLLVSRALQFAGSSALSVRAIQEQVDYAVNESIHGVDLDDVEVTLSPLDPKRPALNLLEAALDGIDACRAAYDLHIDRPANFDDLDPNRQEETSAGRFVEVGIAFAEAVRVRAERDRARLL
ncbi:hypothetical protein [Actinoplanes sp. NPDC051494]|uniref:hypothetical protein n=1 Tax=Actinoplanes sp. NPDC051494 TaxID=3363907 RepID=UPI00379315F7